MFLNFFIPLGAIGVVFSIPDFYAEPTVELAIINSCVMSLIFGFSASKVEYLSKIQRSYYLRGQEGKARVFFFKKSYSFLVLICSAIALFKVIYWFGNKDSMSEIVGSILATSALIASLTFSLYNLFETRYSFTHRFIWGFLLAMLSCTLLYFNILSYQF